MFSSKNVKCINQRIKIKSKLALNIKRNELKIYSHKKVH